jgi:hypothetical protein
MDACARSGRRLSEHTRRPVRLPDTPPTRLKNSYRAWSCHRPVHTYQRFDFIRFLSATRVVARALNPRDESSSSSLTSTNVSLLTSPQPEKRKVGRSIPPLATTHLCRLERCAQVRRFSLCLNFPPAMGPIWGQNYATGPWGQRAMWCRAEGRRVSQARRQCCRAPRRRDRRRCARSR